MKTKQHEPKTKSTYCRSSGEAVEWWHPSRSSWWQLLKGDCRDVQSEDPETVTDKCGLSVHSSSSSSSGNWLCQASEFGVKHRHVRPTVQGQNWASPTREMKPDTTGLNVGYIPVINLWQFRERGLRVETLWWKIQIEKINTKRNHSIEKENINYHYIVTLETFGRS